jgi:hypothetical protein
VADEISARTALQWFYVSVAQGRCCSLISSFCCNPPLWVSAGVKQITHYPPIDLLIIHWLIFAQSFFCIFAQMRPLKMHIHAVYRPFSSTHEYRRFGFYQQEKSGT